MKLPVEDFACIAMAAYRTITSLKKIMGHFISVNLIHKRRRQSQRLSKKCVASCILGLYTKERLVY